MSSGLALHPYDLVAGVDGGDGGSLTIAVIDPHCNDCLPGTDDLHRFRSRKSLERYWRHRFQRRAWEQPPLRLLVAVAESIAGDLPFWMEARGATVLALQKVRLGPFIREAASLQIPPRYRRAHSLAQCAAARLRIGSDLHSLAKALNYVSQSLQEAEAELRRLAAAHPRDSRLEIPLQALSEIYF